MIIGSRNIIDNTNIKQKDIVRKLIIAQIKNRELLSFLSRPSEKIRQKNRNKRKRKQKQKQKKLNF